MNGRARGIPSAAAFVQGFAVILLFLVVVGLVAGEEGFDFGDG